LLGGEFVELTIVPLYRYVEKPDVLQVRVRCRDSAKDDRGYIIYLTGEDLVKLMENAKWGIESMDFPHFVRRFRALVDWCTTKRSA